MATHSSVLAWRIPGTGEPGGLPSMGSHRVGHDWSDLAAAAAAYRDKWCWSEFTNLFFSFFNLSVNHCAISVYLTPHLFKINRWILLSHIGKIYLHLSLICFPWKMLKNFFLSHLSELQELFFYCLNNIIFIPVCVHLLVSYFRSHPLIPMCFSMFILFWTVFQFTSSLLGSLKSS